MILFLLLTGCLYNHDQYLLYLSYLHDDDGDGYKEIEEDCNDANPDINPGKIEYCNGVDDDCDGSVDGEAVDIHVWYQDLDGDGWGNTDVSRYSCEQPALHVDKKGDCDDENPEAHPEATEACDATRDVNCDGFFGDLDSDGAYPCTDCNNYDASVYPGAPEVCDGDDDDCDGIIDNADEVNMYWYEDQDGDGYGVDASPIQGCEKPDGYAKYNHDCDDSNSAISPDLPEYCGDDIDQNCNLLPDHCRSRGTRTWDAMLTGNFLTGVGAVPDITGDGADEILVSSFYGTGMVALVAQQVRGEVDVTSVLSASLTSDSDVSVFGQNFAVGDQDRDGLPDLAIQANELDDRGRVYLVSAGRGGLVNDLAYAILEGPAANAGTGVSLLLLPGDTDSDAQNEVVVGDPFVGSGALYILDQMLTGITQISNADVVFTGEQTDDATGVSAVPLDYDGDGVNDWAIMRMGNTVDRPGGVYLVSGVQDGATSLADADVFLEGTLGDHFSTFPSIEAGDLNEDGNDDLVTVSSYGETVAYGGTILAIEAPFTSGPYSASTTFIGEAGTHADGGYLMYHKVVDMDGDGILDLVAGAPYLDGTFDDAGKVYAFYGPFSGTIGVGAADCIYEGQNQDLLAGSAFAVGDFNGTGSTDLAILEPGYYGAGQISVHWGWGY